MNCKRCGPGAEAPGESRLCFDCTTARAYSEIITERDSDGRGVSLLSQREGKNVVKLHVSYYKSRKAVTAWGLIVGRERGDGFIAETFTMFSGRPGEKRLNAVLCTLPRFSASALAGVVNEVALLWKELLESVDFDPTTEAGAVRFLDIISYSIANKFRKVVP